VSYFAAALARTQEGWSGAELDLDGVEDLDSLTDLVREVADPGGSPAIMFIEEDDEWLGIVRVDGDADPRVFISDRRVVEESELAAMLYEEAAPLDPVDDEDGDDEETIHLVSDPAGDVEVLADLGTPGKVLLELCAEEGQLPADIMTALCERAGCLETLESLREG
jgi:putative tRNA adenosine deaminase-associated protein